MLQLKHIRKSYTTGDFTQMALNDISVSFRDNEFVAVLGPSGSGKTTMLNIVGGLDHYDTGDLVIDGISTKEYKDRDWDTFRNNRIGFVFQSYNLIPHQTILANVELALTLSGVDKEERTQRAKEALEAVGLGDHVNKKPAQLSGGQMQRVAIARALINDPEIVLADEPTGALDSKTSVQIMDLLTDIAKDRLVVMVTHNPELAEKYATRIVTLTDGEIKADTNPYEPTEEEMRESEKEVRPARMGFLTALSLSFNNLMTKKSRTIMTAIAGSIGIIGIAAILALSNGVQNYIKSVEEETLSLYPLQINSTSFDMSTVMASQMGTGGEGEADEAEAEGASNDDGTLHEWKYVTSMFDSVQNNDLASLKAFFDSDPDHLSSYVNSIDYTYDVVPHIFDANTDDGVRQINPEVSFQSMGMGSSANSMMQMGMSVDSFSEMMGDTSIIEGQYDIVAGHWPESYNECVLVLGSNGEIPDIFLYALGLRDHDELDTMVKQFVNEEAITAPEEELDVSYQDILDVKMKLVCAADLYAYDSAHHAWLDKSDDEAYMKDLVNAGEDIRIAGIALPNPDASVTALGIGIFYTPELVTHLIDRAAETQIVKDQVADPSVNVFNGKLFTDESDDDDFAMDSLFSVDQNAIANAFQFDESALQMDESDLDLSGMDLSGMDMGSMDMGSMDMSDMDMSSMMPEFDMGSIDMGDLANDPALQAQMAQIAQAMSAEMATGFINWLTETNANDPQKTNSEYYSQSGNGGMDAAFNAYMSTTGAAIQQKYMGQMTALVGKSVATQVATAMATQMQGSMAQASKAMANAIQAQIAAQMTMLQTQIETQVRGAMQSTMEQLMGQLSSRMSTAMSFDTDAFANAFSFNMAEDDLTSLIMSMMSGNESSYDSNLAELGYADLAKPNGIDIYPKDFESKQEVIAILDGYNERMAAAGEEDKEISYTDLVGTLMTSVTTIIDMISYVLIAFVAISLVVSSIMIGVITYISVLERKKEIGILRAIGASKSDVSRIFNAETIIEGLASGILGVGVTALVCIPVSAIVYGLFGVPNVASLPLGAALILVAISVFLTFIAGLLPASSASRKDPVEALRSE